MNQVKKSNAFAIFSLHILGFLFSVVPPAVCTLMYFPLWRAVGYEECIAGGSVLLLALCAVPLYRAIKRGLSNFSAYIMWLMLFLLFVVLSRIADQMIVISFAGFVGNLVGALCFFGAKRMKESKE